ncbi:MAG: geopeptide radical SAM maturase [Deferrisomatales bacterium]
MVLSPYVKAYPYPDKPGTLLVFSTRKASMCLLPEALFRQLEHGDVPKGAAQALAKLGVLVADSTLERDEVFAYLDRVNRSATDLTVAVIVGMECNFRCAYCYEGRLKGEQEMETATAQRLVEFVGERFRPEMRTVTVDFYGGEPLLYTERVAHISAGLQAFAEERGAKYSFTLVTNGSRLTPSVVQTLVPLGLMGVKVTLDGPAENHDRYRPFRSGRGSFATILKNLQACCDLVPVGLGGTYTRESYRLFPQLLDHLAASGLGPDRIAQVHFGPVVQTTDEHAPRGYCNGCVSVNEPWVSEASVFLRGEALRRGYRVPRIAPTPCMVDLTNAFTVHYDGGLTKCPALIGHDGFVVGDLWTGFRDYGDLFALDRLQREAACRECEYLPLCFGGCRYMQYQREGCWDGVDCQKPFLEATLGALLLQDARYRVAPVT